jgi:hypothetical protein
VGGWAESRHVINPDHFRYHREAHGGGTHLGRTANPDLEQDGALYLNEMLRRATNAMLRLAWMNTIIAVAALVIALIALLK